MCGIIGGYRKGGIRQLLLAGLQRMEYRGYDSAGIALSDGKTVYSKCVVGRVAALKRSVAARRGDIGIGHTRWATHGAVTVANAHPVAVDDVWVVHNGIIENHAQIKAELLAAGRRFTGETDTEVIAHLLAMAFAECGDLLTALRRVCKRLCGAFAFAAMARGSGDIVCIRQGNPLLLGKSDAGVFIASDVQALAGEISAVRYLENGEYARLSARQASVWGADDKKAKCDWTPIHLRPDETQLGAFRHFMQKEIFEQPDAVSATLQQYVAKSVLSLRDFGAGAQALFRPPRPITVLACGTSYHAGLAACGWLAHFGIAARVIIASEYRRGGAAPPNIRESLHIAVSQSGETADTLAAARYAKAQGAKVAAIVNVQNSTLARESDWVFYTQAGVEVGVASTKAFTAQMTALLLLAMALAKARRLLPPADEKALLKSLRHLPHLLRKTLLIEDDIILWAKQLAVCKSALFIGRGALLPLALEGALKLKEISYIHAEGIAAGELKHGSLALVDADMPVIALAPDDELSAKMSANIAEVAARGGKVFTLTGKQPLPNTDTACDSENRIIRLPEDGTPHLSPIIWALPLQILAYHTARQKGTDIDKPRNLAKSVTVE